MNDSYIFESIARQRMDQAARSARTASRQASVTKKVTAHSFPRVRFQFSTYPRSARD